MGDGRAVAGQIDDDAAIGQAQTVGIHADTVNVRQAHCNGVAEVQGVGATAARENSLNRGAADVQGQFR